VRLKPPKANGGTAEGADDCSVESNCLSVEPVRHLGGSAASTKLRRFRSFCHGDCPKEHWAIGRLREYERTDVVCKPQP
jgi:hypothetical protein